MSYSSIIKAYKREIHIVSCGETLCFHEGNTMFLIKEQEKYSI